MIQQNMQYTEYSNKNGNRSSTRLWQKNTPLRPPSSASLYGGTKRLVPTPRPRSGAPK